MFIASNIKLATPHTQDRYLQDKKNRKIGTLIENMNS